MVEEAQSFLYEVIGEIIAARVEDREPANFAVDAAKFIYSEQEVGFWNNGNGWVDFKSATIFTDFEQPGLPSAGVPDARWVSYKEAVTLIDDPEDLV